ncbi:metal-dependent hydrolase [Pseudoteredinibacter isoporae]|uniref:Metal-dependent hydrolase n=1 Tax=Pseudoteredinibacter isoporae TaxID=570281 RepID=A0A7X0MWU8_9GAMM|nr:metal-dependent hydrolase [Pseudoteredinibacter isoporae]MBB6522600.1 hypothetical protein [Pseudoteredinibacter isoporae]NHO88130.1 metal-dependent hydrolase [Pseudoteredinibacter isoporae]NIB23539.1 metal-dependent hydrolase [Pseudoteredinibacter isoporae]
MSQQSHTPEHVDIQPRNREHEIADRLSRDWYGDHPFKTAWFNAMSITFPLGEKFFIDSVRHFANNIDDPKLKQEIRGFCGQENVHRREHERYNESLCSQRGYDLEYMENRLKKKLALTDKMYTPLERLSMTAALEHITAIMAEWALDPESSMAQEADPLMRELWDWHAVEEMEHKAVAFDVFRAVGGDEKMRKKALKRSTFFLLLDIFVHLVHMLKRNGQLWNLKIWWQGMGFLFGKQGILRLIYPMWKEYYQDGFHPWDRDTQEQLHRWEAAQASS